MGVELNSLDELIKSLSSHILCPRCGNDQTTSETQDIPLGTEIAKIPKHRCNNCTSRWFFEEDIIGFLFQSSNVQQTPQIEQTTKTAID